MLSLTQPRQLFHTVSCEVFHMFCDADYYKLYSRVVVGRRKYQGLFAWVMKSKLFMEFEIIFNSPQMQVDFDIPRTLRAFDNLILSHNIKMKHY